MLHALRNRSIALLWLGQALSAVGDEIYRVALIWFAVGLIGADTGYLAASQSAALLALSLVGGKWADQWDHISTMIRVDLLRAGIVLTPVVLNQFFPLSLGILAVVAIALSALSAFFDPALQACLPGLSPDARTLRAATGLMSTTYRMARVLGPGIIALLTSLIPTVHFFTLDALSFAVSAFSIAALREAPRKERRKPSRRRIGYREALAAGFIAIRSVPGMSYCTFCKATAGGAWQLAYGLCLALMVQKIAPGDVHAYGLAVAAYGAGNLSGALVVGNMARVRPARIMFAGFIWLGGGFLLAALTHTLAPLMLIMAFAGFGGPLNDIPYSDLVQTYFPNTQLATVFRLRVALETGATLLFMVAGPFLVRHLSIAGVWAFCGSITVCLGIVGLLKGITPEVVLAA